MEPMHTLTDNTVESHDTQEQGAPQATATLALHVEVDAYPNHFDAETYAWVHTSEIPGAINLSLDIPLALCSALLAGDALTRQGRRLREVVVGLLEMSRADWDQGQAESEALRVTGHPDTRQCLADLGFHQGCCHKEKNTRDSRD